MITCRSAVVRLLAKPALGVCKNCSHPKADHNFFLGSDDRSYEKDKCNCPKFS
jgi:hypothetical protein